MNIDVRPTLREEKKIQLELRNSADFSKISLQILYHLEYGVKTFILNYNCDLTDVSLDCASVKINMNSIFNMVKQYDLKLLFSGFPRCVFEKFILRPDLRWYFEKNIRFLNCKEGSYENKDDCMGIDCKFVKKDSCEQCLFYEKCDGVPEKYLEKFPMTKLNPLFSNQTLYELNTPIVESWNNLEIKEIAKEVLEDFKNETLYMRKKIIFSQGYPLTTTNVKESFDYYIYNRAEDFDETYELLSNFYDKDLLFKIKDCLKNTNLIIVKFFVDEDTQLLNKYLYVKINDFNLEELDNLSKILNLDFDYKDVWGIGMNLTFKERSYYRVVYDYEKLSSVEIKDFVTDLKLTNKMPVLKFANSILKPLCNVMLIKEVVDNKVVSKSISVSLEHNFLRLRQLGILFNINTSFYDDKKVYYFILNASNERDVKISFEYSPRPILEEEEELQESKYKYRY